MATRTAKRDDSYVLGLVPVVVALVFGVLVLPRRAVPDEIPVPLADGRVLAQVTRDDNARAARPLSGDARALGTAIRAFNQLQAKQETDPFATPEALAKAKQAIDEVRAPLAAGARDEELLDLRATQLDAFVVEARAFERTGKESAELVALAGPFVKRLRDVGWCEGSRLLPDEAVLRVMFKLAWDAVVGLDRPPFHVTLDEERALYAFYIRHPHVPEAVKKRIDDARGAAKTDKACASLDEAARMAAEQWRIEKVMHLRAVDPAYPAAYALGVAYYRRHEYPSSAQAFHDWLDAHPDGPWTIRARDYLREALYQAGID